MNPPASVAGADRRRDLQRRCSFSGWWPASAEGINEALPGTEAGGGVGEVIRLLGAAGLYFVRRFHASKLVELPHAVEVILGCGRGPLFPEKLGDVVNEPPRVLCVEHNDHPHCAYCHDCQNGVSDAR